MGEFLKPGFRLLMVDDSEEDIFFVQRALEKSDVGKSFFAVSSAQDAINYLRGEGDYSDRHAYPFPNVLLTDIKMPGMDGFDFLRWLQNHPECRVIPSIAFSSSYAESDVHLVYALGGNAFIAKPPSFEEMVELILITYNFWSRCQIPPPPENQRCG